MAVAKYGAIITDLKGKIGGTIFQGGRSGGTVKNLPRARKIARFKAGQDHSTQNTVFGTVTKTWSQLTQVQRDTWSALVGVWTFVNKFGVNYDATPYQIFTACNINRLNIGLAQLTDAPLFDAAFDNPLTFTDYSLAGVFEGTNTNVEAFGQHNFAQISYGVTPTMALSQVRFPFSYTDITVALVTKDFKLLYQTLFGGDPPLDSVFYIKIWTTKPNYPKKQFQTLYKINVVA